MDRRTKARPFTTAPGDRCVQAVGDEGTLWRWVRIPPGRDAHARLAGTQQTRRSAAGAARGQLAERLPKALPDLDKLVEMDDQEPMCCDSHCLGEQSPLAASSRFENKQPDPDTLKPSPARTPEEPVSR